MAIGALTTCRKKGIQKGFRRKITACRSKAPQGITLKKTNFQPDEIGETVPSIGCKKRENKEGCKRSRDVISECGSIDDYDILNVINQGAYGIVYRVRNKKSGEIVAMKEEFEGLSAESLREIDILRSLNSHPCVIDLKEVVVDDYDGVYIIMEYLENDLKTYMDSRIDSFSVGEVKLMMKQLIEGVKFLHENQVMHRDLKPSNILINNVGGLKICDFGLSIHFGGESGSYSSNVVTLWYRAPEVLLGSRSYSCAIDMWSVGCIMAELMLKEVLFEGESETDQLDKIFRVLGTPNEGVWPGFGSLAGGLAKFVQQPDNLLGGKFSSEFKEGAGFDLLNRLLTYDPDKRITAESALDHAWFKEC